MNKLQVIHKVSKKEGKEPYHYLVLQADMGYGKINLSMDKSVIAEFCEVAVSELFKLEIDKPLVVGTFNKANNK